jgi:hypothetical protein
MVRVISGAKTEGAPVECQDHIAGARSAFYPVADRWKKIQ